MSDKRYVIPGYSKYEITKSGKVFIKANGSQLKGGMSGSGYLSFHLLYDDGGNRVIGLHRLLALTFIPIYNPEGLYVNHIDGDKENNTISNLEWVTPKENVLHAGECGLTGKALSITARNAITGEIRFFRCLKDAAAWAEISKDAMRYRYSAFNGRVFPEGFHYHRGKYEGEWEIALPLEEEMKAVEGLISACKTLLVRDLSTGKITAYNTISAVARLLSLSSIKLWRIVTKVDCPIFPPCYQVKPDDETSWRNPDNLDIEFKRSLNLNPIIIEDIDNGKKIRYNTIKDVVKATGLTTATVKSRLNYGKSRSFDGKIFYRLLKASPYVK